MKDYVSAVVCSIVAVLSRIVAPCLHQAGPRATSLPRVAFGGVIALLAVGLMGPRARAAQSYTHVIPAGFSLIANQLDHGSNTLNELMPVVPNGSVLYKYDNAGSNWTAAGYSAATGKWLPGGLTLNPGEGAFLQSPTNFTLTFTGTPHVPVLPVTIPSGATYLVSRQTNGIGDYANIVGVVPSGGEALYRWNGTGYTAYQNDPFGGGWAPSDPLVSVGEAVWVAPDGGPAPPPLAAAPLVLSWPKTQLVPVGSNATLSVTVAGLGPISYQWFKNFVPLSGSTGLTVTVTSVALSDAAYYYLVASNAFGLTASPTTLLRPYLPTQNHGDRTAGPWDFGDLPSTTWTCWENSSFDDYCNVRSTTSITKSVPPVSYPTTLAANGARHADLGYTYWLGWDFTSTEDGLPNPRAKGDPYTSAGVDEYRKASILNEEDGIRMIPSPFFPDQAQGDLNQNDQNENNTRLAKFMVDPRYTSQGRKGNNLFGSAAGLFIPTSESPYAANAQKRQSYAPGEIVWFTVEAYSVDESPAYLNVWVDYGDATGNPNGNVNGSPDGVFQPNEYVLVDQPLWGVDNLQFYGTQAGYPYDLSHVPTSYGLPNIGVQPYAALGLQVVSFKIPPMTDLTCGKQAFARFRISKQPLNLFRISHVTDGEALVHDACSWPAPTTPGYNTYALPSAGPVNDPKYPDPSLGEITDGGEVEDYPVYFVANSNPSSIYGPSTICLSTLSSYGSIGANILVGRFTIMGTLNVNVDDMDPNPTIQVSNPSAWPVADPLANPATSFYIKLTDDIMNDPYYVEIMKVIDSRNPASWTVADRNNEKCTGPLYWNKDTTSVTLVGPCQCELDQNASTPNYFPSGMLDISGTDPGGPCSPGGPIHSTGLIVAPEQHPFVVQVGNSGAFDLSGVTVSYPVPTNATFQSASVSQGTWTNVGGTVSFNLGLLQVGDTAQIGISFLPKFSGLINHQFNLSADQPLEGSTTYQVLNHVTINPVLAITPSSNQTARITWPTNDVWTLQRSSSVNGGWTNAPSQTSPNTVPTDQAKEFFRLKQP